MRWLLELLVFVLLISALDASMSNTYEYKEKYNEYKFKYEAIVNFEDDFSNHIRKDFGIDTTLHTQYKQINNKVNVRK